jgi:hypothetical protein
MRQQKRQPRVVKTQVKNSPREENHVPKQNILKNIEKQTKEYGIE